MMNQPENFLNCYPASHYLLACSAGVDSMVMLHWFQEKGLSFSVAHVNYQLREQESDEDALFVERICEANNIPFYLKTIDLSSILKDKGGNLQDLARAIRYTFFREIQGSIDAKYVVTAHHKDDQIETFFLHLFRQSGLAGLSGMAICEQGILRPFLSCSKEDILTYAKEKQLAWREDSSNSNPHYLRNKFRIEWLPLLVEQQANLKEDIIYLQGILRKNFEEYHAQAVALSSQWNTQRYIPLSDLQHEKTILVEAFKLLKIEPRFMTPILNLAHLENNKKILLHEHSSIKELVKFQNNIYLIGDQFLKQFSFEITKVNSLPEQFNTLTFYLNSDLPTNGFELVYHQGHEQFVPLGLQGKKSVNAILKANAIPEFMRREWPVLKLNNAIVGIPGVALNREFKPGQALNSYIKITFTEC